MGLLFACGSDSETIANDSQHSDSHFIDSSKADTISKALPREFPTDTFLLDQFTAAIDSFFTDYAQGELEVKYRLYSFTKRDTMTNVRYILMPVNGSVINQYDFDAGKSNASLTFRVYEAGYNSEADVVKAWKEFKRLTGMPHSDEADDRFPCISYCNDIAFRTETKIFWISADCGFAEGMFRKMNDILRRCIYRCRPQDEVTCERGDGLPEQH